MHRFECAEQLGAGDDLTWSGIGYALLALGRDEPALEAARRAAHHNPASTDACRILAAALAFGGREDEAAAMLWRLLELDPTCSLRAVRRRFGATEGGGARLLSGLRRAGLAEASSRPRGGSGAIAPLQPVRDQPEPRRVLLVVQPGAAEREVTLEVRPLLVGRGANADVLLGDHRVSRAHCRIVLADGEVTVTDLNSTNGTFIDGRRIAATTVLESGAVVQLGGCRLEYRAEYPADPDDTISMSAQPSLFGRMPRQGS